MVTEVKSMDDFKAKIATPGKVVFVNVFTMWCPGYHLLTACYEKLCTEHPNCLFVKVDAEVVKDVAEEHSVNYFPTVLVFKEGEKVASKVVKAAPRLKELAEAHDKA